MNKAIDIDLQNAIGGHIEFEHYTQFGVGRVTGTLIEVIPGKRHNHCRIEVDQRFSNLPEVMTISANDILNRLELIGYE